MKPIDHKIERTIGHHICFSVHEALTHSKQRVLIKVLDEELQADTHAVEGFLASGRALRKLNSRNICCVLECGKIENSYVIVSEAVRGKSLADVIDNTGTRSLAKNLDLIRSIARALQRVHLAGLVHGMLSPKNIYLTEDGKIKIDDCGFYWYRERLLQRNLRNDAYLCHFLAPEVYRPEAMIDGRADIYSLGVILYFLLRQRTPYNGDMPVELAKAHLEGTLPPISRDGAGFGGTVDRFFDKALAKSAQKRFLNLNAFLAGVDYLESAALDKVRQPVPVAPAPEKSQVWRYGLIAGGAILAFLLAFFIIRLELSPTISKASFDTYEDEPGEDEPGNGSYDIREDLQQYLSTTPSENPETQDTSDFESAQPGDEQMAPDTPEPTFTAGLESLTKDHETGLTSAPGPGDEHRSATRSGIDYQRGEQREAIDFVGADIMVRANGSPVVAEVFVDNLYRGTTDRQGHILVNDLHANRPIQVKILKKGYETISEIVWPADSAYRPMFSFNMVPVEGLEPTPTDGADHSANSGGLTLAPLPYADSIFVDGKAYFGKTPLKISLEEGPHRVRFVNKEFNSTWETNVEVRQKQLSIVRHDFANLEYGTVLISLRNAEQFGHAYVYVDRRLWRVPVGMPLRVDLPVGLHKISITRDGFAASPSDTTIQVDRNQIKEVTFSLTKRQGAGRFSGSN